jgi:hypothetical protein
LHSHLAPHDHFFSPVIFDLDSVPATDSIEYKIVLYRRLVAPFDHLCQIALYRDALPFSLPVSPIHLYPRLTPALLS